MTIKESLKYVLTIIPASAVAGLFHGNFVLSTATAAVTLFIIGCIKFFSDIGKEISERKNFDFQSKIFIFINPEPKLQISNNEIKYFFYYSVVNTSSMSLKIKDIDYVLGFSEGEKIVEGAFRPEHGKVILPNSYYANGYCESVLEINNFKEFHGKIVDKEYIRFGLINMRLNFIVETYNENNKTISNNFIPTKVIKVN